MSGEKNIAARCRERWDRFLVNNPTPGARVKKIIKKSAHVVTLPLQYLMVVLLRTAYKYMDKSVEHWTWERFKRVEKKLSDNSRTNRYLTELLAKANRIPYHDGEKIRLVYLFQIPSCWPSFQSVWEILKDDERFDVRFLLYDREQREKNQMKGAREFLIASGIPFEAAEEFDFEEFEPHIMIYQTPWDDSHRPDFLKSDAMSSLGIRIAYVPYGIEYSQDVWSDYIFSNNKFLATPWRVYTLSPQMKTAHRLKSAQGAAPVRVTGYPKFDIIYNALHSKGDLLPPALRQQAAGRKIVFWQMHFPAKDGTPDVPETSIYDYIQFAKYLPELQDRFFVLARPHPKFEEQYAKFGMREQAREFFQLLAECPNVYMYDEPKYMPALISADCIIGDRSALMVESCVLDKPTLYMTNLWYKERMLDAVAPIFDSYYQGSEFYDMKLFLDFVVEKGFDYKRETRRQAAAQCVPFFDGQCGRRIVEDLVKGLLSEEVK